MAGTESAPTAHTTIVASLSVRVRRAFPVLKPYLIGVAAVLATYLLFGWLALPAILQSQAEKYIHEHGGHQLTMDRPSFNPILLDLRLRNLHLADPDGKPLLSFEDLLIDFSPVSVFRRAYIFNEIRLEGLAASVELLREGQLNWSNLIESLQSKAETPPEEQKPSAPPRLIVRKFSLSDGRVDLADRRTNPEWSASVLPIDIELTELSTLPNETGKYEVTANTNFGADIHWDGQIALNPFSVAGSIKVDAFPLAKVATLAPMPPALAAPEGMASLETQYQAGTTDNGFDVRLDDLSVGIKGFSVQGKTDTNASLAFDGIDLKGGQFDLRERRVAIDTIAVNGGGLKAERTAAGRINLLDLMPPEKKDAAAPTDRPSSATANDWHYRVEHVTLNGFSAGFRDRTIDPAADIALQDIAAEVSGVSEDMATPLPAHLAFRSRDGGTFSAEGKVVPADTSADMQIKLDGLAVKPAQPYLGHFTTLTLADGALSSEGHATYDAKGGRYTGSFAVQNLRIVEGDASRPFLAWKSLSTGTLTATPKSVDIGELVLNGLDTRLLIAEDKSTNLGKILRQQPSDNQPPAATESASSPFPVHIERLQIQDSQLEFADRSLALPFGTHIHALAGTVLNISSAQGGTPAQVKLGGQIDNYGSARAEGQLDLVDPTNLLNINVVFNNVEMKSLTPYSATFAGRRINSGKLTLNLQYQIKNRQLTGNNKVVMDRLVLGERVESPEAKDLPLDLAIAILEDSKGRIDLGLPVKGSLDDPQFSIGAIVWDAFVNVVTKVVTAPFRALGALFGGGEDFQGFVFEPGQPTLSPSEREKLVQFAGALNQRPNLMVTVHGTWANADRIALQDLALRKQLAGKLGLSTDGDPGPITTDQPKVRSALEDLYADKFGSGALAGLKEGYRKANPGELPETTGGQVMSALTGLFGTKSSLSDQDIEALKGADFYGLLYLKLRDAEEMPDTKLQELAQARGEGIVKELSEANAPPDRITLQATEKVDAGKDGVPLKVEMASVRQSQARAAGQGAPK
ncbi:MAG TPA: DUF748 domain-containing protein [Alphaproteobacteria bacterium]|jgi:uncharacterized protein involved in outer membrane biogenesis|nr:DUF748 domain-containing protein [Alphaproteobacteria bacterium]